MITAKEADSISYPLEYIVDKKIDSAIRHAIATRMRSCRVDIQLDETWHAKDLLKKNGFNFSFTEKNDVFIFLIKW